MNRSLPRIALDLLFWVIPITVSVASGQPWVTLLAIAWIGAVPMHDLLVHGHEATHRHAARTRWLNEGVLWFTNALVWVSGTAYRAFHLDHHKYARTERDPEQQLLSRIARAVPGWAYLGLPAVAHLEVNTYPFRRPEGRAIRPRVVAELVGAALLHAGIALGFGIHGYLLYVFAPTFTSLSAVVILRSLCEHHGASAHDPWTNTRTMDAGKLLDFLWSNTSYHLEHHLHPGVPCRELPALRARLAGEMRRRGSPIDRGFLRTSLALLRDARHVREAPAGQPEPRAEAFVRTEALAFKMKVRWFLDLLAHVPSRRHLWSLYFAGEAYQALHPEAVFVGRLEEPLSSLLARQLADETRHAETFRGLLAAEGLRPAALPPEEDVGYFLLSQVAPDIVARAGEASPFTRDETMRYMAFLHVLELRSLSDLAALIEAARRRGEISLAAGLSSILGDERFHASYTHAAVLRLAADGAEARRVLDRTRRAERRHYARVLDAILRRFETLGAAPLDVLGRLRWRLMRALASLGLAVPLLPLYDRLPARLTSAA
jgi:fatty acid desaturase